jgi:tol-pal system protein YbgF
MKKVTMSGLAILWIGLSISGCATIGEVETLDAETRQIYARLNSVQKENEALRKEMAALHRDTQKEMADLQEETKRSQADLLLRTENLQSDIRTLSTSVEEYKDYLKRPSKEIDRVREDAAFRIKVLEEKVKTIEGKNKALEDRNRFLEENLRGLEGKVDRTTSKQTELEKSIQAKEKETPPEAKGISARTGDLYKDAYETFQKGDLEEARRKFETFLKQYPNTELSDNAQFWIGETYYLKKDYEKAILEYEKAIAKYPEGDKIPAALFKQALAFGELGDKTNARNLLKRVIERYPHSDQAEMAKRKLESLK